MERRVVLPLPRAGEDGELPGIDAEVQFFQDPPDLPSVRKVPRYAVKLNKRL